MRTPQEDVLVVEALLDYAESNLDVHPRRAIRARLLAKEIAAIHGLELEDALRQRVELSRNRR